MNDEEVRDQLRDDLKKAFPEITDGIGRAVYESITNRVVTFGGVAIGFTFRAAGDFVAELAGEGDYLEWYCGATGHLRAEVRDALEPFGWTFSEMSDADENEHIFVFTGGYAITDQRFA